MLEKINKILQSLNDLRPDAEWRIFGSAARIAYQVDLAMYVTEQEPNDIDIVTNGRFTRWGFEVVVRAAFDVIDIEFGDTGNPERYDNLPIRKRIRVLTAEYGWLDFVFVAEDFIMDEWIKDYQYSSYSKVCVQKFVLGNGHLSFQVTKDFQDAVVRGKEPHYDKRNDATFEHKKKVAKLVDIYLRK